MHTNATNKQNFIYEITSVKNQVLIEYIGHFIFNASNEKFAHGFSYVTRFSTSKKNPSTPAD